MSALFQTEEVIHPPSERKALEWITALAAEGLPYRLSRAGTEWRLAVPVEQSAAAWAAITAYEEVNVGWPPQKGRPISTPARAHPIKSGLWGAGFIAMVFICFGPYSSASPWLRAAAADSIGMMAGQWWRPITALTLHADFPHLGGNMVFITILGGAVCRGFGLGLGWALILAAGIAGNVLTALMANEPHLAVGASTSCFGALGVLSTYQALENHRRYGDWKSVWSRVWIPLGGGLAMFGLLGVNPGSDIAAHAWGFGCGLILAVPFVVPRTRTASETVDAFLKVGTVLTIMFAWRAALRFAS